MLRLKESRERELPHCSVSEMREVRHVKAHKLHVCWRPEIRCVVQQGLVEQGQRRQRAAASFYDPFAVWPVSLSSSAQRHDCARARKAGARLRHVHAGAAAKVRASEDRASLSVHCDA